MEVFGFDDDSADVDSSDVAAVSTTTRRRFMASSLMLSVAATAVVVVAAKVTKTDDGKIQLGRSVPAKAVTMMELEKDSFIFCLLCDGVFGRFAVVCLLFFFARL